jgi:uncharacterized LabA/DUF88 family protein
MVKRAIFYVDGFNLYHAIDDLVVDGKKVPHLKWFSLKSYAEFVCSQSGESLEKVRYFSALAYHSPSGIPRHQSYLRALKSTGVQYKLGQFKEKPKECKKCFDTWIGHEEKETDVNIAVQIIEDAMDNLMEVAYVISADSDLSPAIKLLKRRFPEIEYVAIAPPQRRHASELLQLCVRNLKIGMPALKYNRLPERIEDASGILVCPDEYLEPLIAPEQKP